MSLKIVRRELFIQHSTCKHSRHVRSWSNKGHIAFEHIDELGKLIKAALAQNATQRCHAWVVGRRLARASLVAKMRVHRPELVDQETTIVVAVALLPKKDWTGRRGFDCNGNANQQRSQNQQSAAGTKHV